MIYIYLIINIICDLLRSIFSKLVSFCFFCFFLELDLFLNPCQPLLHVYALLFFDSSFLRNAQSKSLLSLGGIFTMLSLSNIQIFSWCSRSVRAFMIRLLKFDYNLWFLGSVLCYLTPCWAIGMWDTRFALPLCILLNYKANQLHGIYVPSIPTC